MTSSITMRYFFALVVALQLVIFVVNCAEESCIQYKDQHVEFNAECLRRNKNVKPKVKIEPATTQGSERDVDYHAVVREKRREARAANIDPAEQESEFWIKVAEEELREALKQENLNTNVAKNVILFLGDGMGIPSITAGRILKGQLQGQRGEEYKLAMDKFPHVGFAKTYNVDHQVPDSAGTATAYLTGVKTDYGLIGLNAKANYQICSSAKGNEVESIAKKSHDEGKSVGIVTTTRLNHATPSAAYAHSASRYWYDDTDLSAEAKENNCVDIAQQLYDHMPEINVALGGARCYFRPNTVSDEEDPTKTYCRKDGQDLIEKWKINMENMNKEAKFVWNKEQLFDVDTDNIDHLWGMFSQRDMDYDVDADKTMDPTLAEMTEVAINILKTNENGYFLLVEGGRIDHSHHAGNAYRALHEVVAFDNAIQKAVNMTSDEDTLIVVTADHSHTFMMGAYGDRGQSIFGLAPELVGDLKPITTLSYGNGPGYQGKPSEADGILTERENITEERAADKDYLQQTAVPLSSESHGGEDVAIMALGPMAHLFNGVHEQNYIAHAMMYSSCVGDNKDHCLNREAEVELKPTTTEPPIKEEDPITFLGSTLTNGDAEAALNAMFSLEIIFSFVIIVSGGYLIKKL